MERKYIIALEISGTQVKGALASVPAKGSKSRHTLAVEAIAARDNISDSVRHGRVQNLINTATTTNEVIRQLLETPAISGGTIDGCYAVLGGRSLHSEKTNARIELQRKAIITRHDVKSLYAEAAKNAPNGTSVIKVLPRRIFVDGTEQNPVGVMGSELHGEFTLILCDPANKHNVEMVIDGKCRVPVIEHIPAAIAQGCLLLGEEERQKGCMLVDIGAQTITIAIYKELALQYLATLPMGSQNITRDISTGMNMTMDKAEITKCALGNAMPDPNRPVDESFRTNSYVAARAIEIAANIAANIKYAGYSRNDLPGGIVLCGRGVRLKNFDRLIGEQCKLSVRRARLPQSIDLSDIAIDGTPTDYLSLLTVTDMVSRRAEFTPSVSFETPYDDTDDYYSPDDDTTIFIPETDPVPAPAPEPTAPEFTAPATPVEPVPQPVPQPVIDETPAPVFNPPVPEVKVSEPARSKDGYGVDINIQDDTPVDPVETPKKGLKGVLDNLRDKWAGIVKGQDDTPL